MKEIQNVYDYFQENNADYQVEKQTHFNLTQEIYEAITLFQNSNMLKKLLISVPNNYKLHDNGYTCFHYASEIGSIEMLNYIKEHGDDPNFRCHSGITPIMLASLKGHISCINALIEFGANTGMKDFQLG